LLRPDTDGTVIEAFAVSLTESDGVRA
jgi:hypothetical protein